MEKNSPVESNVSNAPLIELAQVEVASARDQDVVQLESVDWRVHAGDFWIVGGARAVGKTDLIATAAALQRPRRGSVRLFGQDISELNETNILEQRLRIGFVFKNGGRMLTHLTVAENISLPLRYHNHCDAAQIDERVEKILAWTGLTPFAHNTAGMLSAPRQRRVGLARALALQPRVLFLDEPLADLETREKNWWLDFLAQLSGGETMLRQPTLVITTNRWQPWEEHGRQFALLKNKRWLALGGRAELKNNAQALSIESAAED